jgi:predicted transcriptional regulator
MTQALVQIRPDSDAAFAEEIELTKEAMRTGIPSEPIATFTFSSVTQMFSVFSPKRWELIQQLQKLGPSTIRGLTRALGRDVRRVHDDIGTLMEWGIVERDESGKVFVPYDVIRINADVRAAAA